MKRLILLLIAVAAWGQIPAPGGSGGGGGGGAINSCANLGDAPYYSGATTLSCPATAGVGFIYNSTTGGVISKSGLSAGGASANNLISTSTSTDVDGSAGNINLFGGNCTVGGAGVGSDININPGACPTGTPGIANITAAGASSNILVMRNSVGSPVCTVGPTGALTGACAPSGTISTGTVPRMSYYSGTSTLSDTNNLTWNTGLVPMIVGHQGDFTAAVTSAAFGHYVTVDLSNGTPDTFVWSIDGGSDSAPVNVTGSQQTITTGFSITFPAATGNANHTWTLVPIPGPRLAEGGRLWIGETPAVLASNANGYAVPDLMVSSTGTSFGSYNGVTSYYIGNGTGYDVNFYTSQGTPAAPTIVSTGNILGYTTYQGYDGSDYNVGASDLAYVDSGVIGFPFPGGHCIDGGPAGLNLRSSGNIGVLNKTAPCAIRAEDLGFRRSAAGVLEVNTGTVGTVAAINVSGVRYNGAVPASSAIDFGSIADGACADNTFTLTGAAANDKLAQSWPAALTSGLHGTMFVSAADTVTVRLCNLSGGSVDPASGSFGAAVIR